jgi:hypothetical protein
MTITYTKAINTMSCYTQIDGQTNVVFTIQWVLVGAEDTYLASAPAITNVPYVAGDPFIPYADLTETEVNAWIDQYTTAEQMALLEQQVADSIAQQKAIQYPPLPWVPSPTPTA